jgi:hypothetical protein
MTMGRGTIGLACAWVLVGITLFVGFPGESMPSQAAKVVEASRFVVRDAQGRIRASLDSNGFILADQNQVVRVVLGATPAGEAALTLYDSNGKVRAGLAIVPEQVVLSIYDQNEKKRVALGVRPDGSPGLVFLADNEDPRMVLNVLSEGTPYVVMRDQNGQARVTLGIIPNGKPTIGLQDKHGTTRVFLTEAGIATFRPAGTLLWRSPEP